MTSDILKIWLFDQTEIINIKVTFKYNIQYKRYEIKRSIKPTNMI